MTVVKHEKERHVERERGRRTSRFVTNMTLCVQTMGERVKKEVVENKGNAGKYTKRLQHSRKMGT